MTTIGITNERMVEGINRTYYGTKVDSYPDTKPCPECDKKMVKDVERTESYSDASMNPSGSSTYYFRWICGCGYESELFNYTTPYRKLSDVRREQALKEWKRVNEESQNETN